MQLHEWGKGDNGAEGVKLGGIWEGSVWGSSVGRTNEYNKHSKKHLETYFRSFHIYTYTRDLNGVIL